MVSCWTKPAEPNSWNMCCPNCVNRWPRAHAPTESRRSLLVVPRQCSAIATTTTSPTLPATSDPCFGFPTGFDRCHWWPGLAVLTNPLQAGKRSHPDCRHATTGGLRISASDVGTWIHLLVLRWTTGWRRQYKPDISLAVAAAMAHCCSCNYRPMSLHHIHRQPLPMTIPFAQLGSWSDALECANSMDTTPIRLASSCAEGWPIRNALELNLCFTVIWMLECIPGVAMATDHDTTATALSTGCPAPAHSLDVRPESDFASSDHPPRLASARFCKHLAQSNWCCQLVPAAGFHCVRQPKFHCCQIQGWTNRPCTADRPSIPLNSMWNFHRRWPPHQHCYRKWCAGISCSLMLSCRRHMAMANCFECIAANCSTNRMILNTKIGPLCIHGWPHAPTIPSL